MWCFQHILKCLPPSKMIIGCSYAIWNKLQNYILNQSCNKTLQITATWKQRVVVGLVLVTERLLPERMSDLILAGSPAVHRFNVNCGCAGTNIRPELRSTYALRLHRTNISISTPYCYGHILFIQRMYLIPKIYSKKLNQIF